jgi:dihydroflavonol-4-reductase
MILVTGGSGFLGQHLVRHLSAQGMLVRALYNSHAPTGALASLAGVDWVQCDLLDVYAVEEAMAGITDIYHCAAFVTFDPRQRDDMLHFNPEATANIVNQAVQQGIRKMVHVSSVAALGRTGDTGKVIDEEQEWGESKYNSAYGMSKYLAENEVWRGVGEGLCAVIINPSVILGEGDWDKGSSQLLKVANNEFPFYTDGVTGWVDVKDVVAIMVQLMGSEQESERYIVSAGNLPFRDVFTLMAKALNKRPPRMHANKLVTGIVWRMSMLYSKLTGKNAAITRETALNAQSVSEYDNGKLLKAFPQFSYIPIRETINRMAESFTRDTIHKHP